MTEQFAARAALLNNDGHCDLRIVKGRIADEDTVVCYAVALLGGAGFCCNARYAVAWQA